MNWSGVTEYKIQIQQNDTCLKLEPELINIAILGIDWHRASTSMYLLTFRVRVMLPQQRNPYTDYKPAQSCTTRGHPLPLPQVTSGFVQ